jgi:hypothetical protein
VTAVLSGTRPGALALGRVAAALTAASAVVHVLQATATSLAALVMALMAVACLPCAWHLWRSPTASVWGLTALLDVTMLLLHLQLLADGTPQGHHAGSAGGLMWTGLALAAGSLSVSAVALIRRDRRAASPRSG